jgi:phosphopentomutase
LDGTFDDYRVEAFRKLGFRTSCLFRISDFEFRVCAVKRRAVVLVCDGLGLGAAPDAGRYGDAGSDTLGHVLDAAPVELPNLAALGLLRAGGRGGSAPDSAWGRMREVSAGKDSTTGHWEMMGIVTERPFPLYPRGFPPEVLEPIEREIGVRFLGNVPASGTEIIRELGPEHLATKRPILYTSGDSVFQIAAHEEIVPPARLWEMCAAARRRLVPPHGVGRVIARPFVGSPGNFVRTANRRDFSLPPPGPTFLDRAQEAGVETFGIGKIVDIFAGRGLSGFAYSGSDADGIAKTAARLDAGAPGLVFTNLVDFDSKYGHRSDPAGYAANLARLDAAIPALRARLSAGDLLILTADHGCDPSDVSTDHTREFVPFLVSGPRVAAGAELGTRASFRDLAATLEEWFGLPAASGGRSALAEFLP